MASAEFDFDVLLGDKPPFPAARVSTVHSSSHTSFTPFLDNRVDLGDQLSAGGADQIGQDVGSN